MPAPVDPDALVLQARGEEHETRDLDSLRADRDVVVIERTRDFAVAAAATIAAMTAGAPAIYQGALKDRDCFMQQQPAVLARKFGWRPQ